MNGFDEHNRTVRNLCKKKHTEGSTIKYKTIMNKTVRLINLSTLALLLDRKHMGMRVALEQNYVLNAKKKMYKI